MRITRTTSLVLDALARGAVHGFDIIDRTGLPSGTVYPILRRLERDGFAAAHWEDAATAHAEQRPPRRYYDLTRTGRALVVEARARHLSAGAATARGRRLRPVRSS